MPAIKIKERALVHACDKYNSTGLDKNGCLNLIFADTTMR